MTFGGNDAFRDPLQIDAEQFVAVKGFKAKGKRISTWQIDSIEELPPLRQPEREGQPSDSEEQSENESSEQSVLGENLDPDAGKSERQVRDEITGQLNLFPDEI